MAKGLLIFSILLGLVSAFLGFQTKQKADQLVSDLKTTKSTLRQKETTLKKTQDDLSDTKKTLEDTQESLKKSEEDLTNAKGQLATAQSDLKKAQDDVDEKSKKIADIQAKMDELVSKIGKIDIEGLPKYLEDLTAQKTKLETELAEAKTVQETLNKQATELQSTVDTKERTIQEYKQGFVRTGLTGKVVAYNPGWNFVVLNIGDKQGLKSGVQMVVLRDGAMVGKIRVTSVEPSTAIADVLPGSVARGEAVQPGDSVVFEGRR